MGTLRLGPYTRARGAVLLPGSKSISNRALLLAAVAHGETVIEHLLDADDTRVMRAALEALGVRCIDAPPRCTVHGAGGVFPKSKADLFLGNAGTAVRMLTAALALSARSGATHYRISGVPRMHERPMGDLVDSLRKVGAQIDYAGCAGFPPLIIRSMRRASMSFAQPLKIRGSTSSQFLSALLMALPLLSTTVNEPIQIEVEGELISQPYIEMTLQLMQQFGVCVERQAWRCFTVPAGARYQSPGYFKIEGDASSASYFLAAGALGGGPVRVLGVGGSSIQGDIAFTDALIRMGAQVMMGDDWIEARGQPPLKAIDLDCVRIPDAAMTLAVAALFATGASTLRNIGSWRVKETDRITAMTRELRKLGASVEAGADGLRITPPSALVQNVAIDTCDDHRMAMSFSLISLANAPVCINDPICVAKTFPEYFECFSTVIGG